MNRIAICRKCGAVTDEGVAKKYGKCLWCDAISDFALIDVTREELKEKYYPEFEKICKERGEYLLNRGSDMLDEQIRKDYFYGKLDQQLNQSLVNKREYESTNEYQNKLYHESKERLQEILDKQQAQQASMPKCPICGSTDLTKISAFSKVAGVKLFGLLGTGNLGKTYKCRSCGAKF